MSREEVYERCIRYEEEQPPFERFTVKYPKIVVETFTKECDVEGCTTCNGCAITNGGSEALVYRSGQDMVGYIIFPARSSVYHRNRPEIMNFFLNGKVCACCLQFIFGREHYAYRNTDRDLCVGTIDNNRFIDISGRMLYGRITRGPLRSIIKGGHVLDMKFQNIYEHKNDDENRMFDISIGELHFIETRNFNGRDIHGLANVYTDGLQICTNCLHKLPLVKEMIGSTYYYTLPYELSVVKLFGDKHTTVLFPQYNIYYPIGG